MLFVGLTGGIGSGKSAVSDALGARGAAIVDTDVIAHALTAPGGAAIAAIRSDFGSEFLTAAGALDRARMRALAFSNPAARKRLQDLLHPLIRARAEAQAAQATGVPYIVFVVPLLVESGNWINRVDRILVVDCSVATQIERVARRSALDEHQIRAIIAQQSGRAGRLRCADDILVNEADIATLVERVDRLHHAYCAQGAAASL